MNDQPNTILDQGQKIAELQDDVKRLTGQNAWMKTTLEWYANSGKYELQKKFPLHDVAWVPILNDLGGRARMALSALQRAEVDSDPLNTILDQGLQIAELLDEVKLLTADLAALRATQSKIHLFAISDGAEAVWQAWHDAMLAQGRDVPPERMAWETLPQRDRQLDALIASGVIASYAKWMVNYAAEISE